MFVPGSVKVPAQGISIRVIDPVYVKVIGRVTLLICVPENADGEISAGPGQENDTEVRAVH